MRYTPFAQGRKQRVSAVAASLSRQPVGTTLLMDTATACPQSWPYCRPGVQLEEYRLHIASVCACLKRPDLPSSSLLTKVPLAN